MKKETSYFRSTRDTKLSIPFWQSVVQGMAADGGLLIPQNIPSLANNFFKNKKNFEKLQVHDISFLIHRLFIPKEEISDDELRTLMKSAHNFPIPLESLDDTTHILRIDRGPTASFKDIAARSLARLIEKYCEHSKTTINIVVATSGDTGVAIADAFGNSKYVSVTVLYPTDGVSEVQEKQMLEVHHTYKNEQVIPIKGNFDNCQDIAKLLQSARYLTSKEKVDAFINEAKVKLHSTVSNTEASEIKKIISTLNLSSANSINIWRLVPQITQYIVSYTDLVKKGSIRPGERVVFAIPTGNVGHLMAGMYAMEIGLPVKKFIVGTNANNVLANIIGSGLLKHGEFVNTSSPSMDILDPSNLERLLSLAQEKSNSKGKIDYVHMKNDIKTLENSTEGIDLKKYGVSKEILKTLRNLIWAEDIETDDEVYAMMAYSAHKYKTVLEPHGTTALIATIRVRSKHIISEKENVIIFETAHPDKFPRALREAGTLNHKRFNHPVLKRLEKTPFKKFKKPEAVDPKDLKKIAQKISEIAIQ